METQTNPTYAELDETWAAATIHRVLDDHSDDWTTLDSAEYKALVVDIWCMMRDEDLSPKDAVSTLFKRIGRASLREYAACIVSRYS